MPNRFLIFFVGILLGSQLRAQQPEYYQLDFVGNKSGFIGKEYFLEGKISKKIILQLDSIYKKNPSAYEFSYNPKSQKLKVFVHCSFDFYSIIDGELIKDYKFSNRGYTCGSHLFEKNDSYHIISGRGLWNYHVDLMEFDSIPGSWEFTPTTNQPLDYFPIGVYQNSKGIATIFGYYNNPRVPRLENELNGYFLDFEKKSWRPLRVDIKEFNLGLLAHENESRFYESQDYSLNITTTQLPRIGWYLWILFEKETGKLYSYEGTTNSEIFLSPYIEVVGNKVTYFSLEPNSVTEGKEVTLDLDEIRKKSREIGQVVLLENQENKGISTLTTILPWIGVPLLFLLALWMGIQLQKRTDKKGNLSLEKDLPQENVQEEKEEEIMDHLLAHNGEKLSTETFDQLLGINEISNFDSKRIKRSRLIKSINKQYEEKNGFPLITRIKNQEDKRFVFYKITFKNEN